ncbi:GNAT family N-acetyltransferase [Niabella drilacis]|uniref:Acetyltransferase (GNAT) domain-containing protein n=1 Tax=Niabella drilacis (strain DSM 25811 / CCM 8410 / CCUG 62505 / LMG 26954 / E90) TaxID=1285928 RepID=A0A1G6IWW5_NIADE|nr:GNAT family N-acetyltransferase [Niabella drilacis]SDC10920.1 Acetyltransferase (GNAT) domain-containing protein [Niabella drilacis]
MIKAGKRDRAAVVDILANAFDDNRSVNYIVRQDAGRRQRIKALMAYAFDRCMLSGEVFITEEGRGCALVLFPDLKKSTMRSVLLDLKLVLRAIGSNVFKVLKREAALKKTQVVAPLYYLWFIGVHREVQGRGTGSRLLNELKQRADELGRVVCLETSTIKNIPWYEKHGFRVYNELNLGYPLYFMKWEKDASARVDDV